MTDVLRIDIPHHCPCRVVTQWRGRRRTGTKELEKEIKKKEDRIFRE
jgi:hypothetical protein